MTITERKVYSQNGEDGVIESIFAAIGTRNKVAVEIGVIGCEGGRENNTRLLAEQGWLVNWIDMKEPKKLPFGITFKQMKATPDNIVATLGELDVPIDLDLLSVDIDGNDYHICAALRRYKPAVVVVEYMTHCGLDEYVFEYDDAFVWRTGSLVGGASLTSYWKFYDWLGYHLVYCEDSGVNAFFVRSDLNPFDALTPEQAYKPFSRTEWENHPYRKINGG